MQTVDVGELAVSAYRTVAYEETARRNAGEESFRDGDFVFVHDPQPAAILSFADKANAKRVWRWHIDTSQPQPETWDYVAKFVDGAERPDRRLPRRFPRDGKERTIMTTRRSHGGQLRWNTESQAWSILAPGRQDRPHVSGRAGCPFCPGPGEDTPPETWRLPDGDGWFVRTVPNRYALSDRHEIVIESPRHDWDLSTATVAEAAAVLSAWQTRHRELRAGAAQIAVFRNHGPAAGISLAHPHSQIAGLPVLSESARRNLEVTREHHARTGRRLAEDLLAVKLSTGSRIVSADEEIVAFSPFSGTANYEVWFVPRTPAADFAAAPRSTVDALAQALRTVLAALRGELSDPAYNLVVHTAPTGYEDAPFAAWSVRLVPRLEIAAGLELATGIPVVTVAPETAATRLRARIAPSLVS